MKTEIDINHEHDYSNRVIEIEIILSIVKYCEVLYEQLLKLQVEEEEKNKILKMEFRDYQYKKSFKEKLEIIIREKGKSFGNINCKNYDSFLGNVKSGHLENIESLTIILNMSFRRGKETSLEEYENLFKMDFKPYDIKFVRTSNHSDENMDQIENNFIQLFNQFKIQNSIFCTKE